MRLEVTFSNNGKAFPVQMNEDGGRLDANFGEFQIVGGGGDGGFSPIVDLTETEAGVDITVTDAEGVKSATVRNGKDGKDGRDGQDGYTPVKGVDYFDGRDGVDGYTPVKGKDYVDGQDGAPGKDGQPGQDGFSPVVAVQDISGGHRVTITDKDGEKAFNVLDGKDGKDGEGGGGAAVQADWAVNDESNPAYVKNRPFYSYTPPPIVMHVKGTENADSFDASALGLGVFVKIYDEPLSYEYMTILQCENLSEWYGNANDFNNNGPFDVKGTIMGQDGIGWAYDCALYADSPYDVYLASFEVAIDLTSVYGFNIPSPGVYLYIPNENVHIDRIELRHLEVVKKIPPKYRQPVISAQIPNVPKDNGIDETGTPLYDEKYQGQAIFEELDGEFAFVLVVETPIGNPLYIQMNGNVLYGFKGTHVDCSGTDCTIDTFTLDTSSPVWHVGWRRKTFNIS